MQSIRTDIYESRNSMDTYKLAPGQLRSEARVVFLRSGARFTASPLSLRDTKLLRGGKVNRLPTQWVILEPVCTYTYI